MLLEWQMVSTLWKCILKQVPNFNRRLVNVLRQVLTKLLFLIARTCFDCGNGQLNNCIKEPVVSWNPRTRSVLTRKYNWKPWATRTASLQLGVSQFTVPLRTSATLFLRKLKAFRLTVCSLCSHWHLWTTSLFRNTLFSWLSDTFS